MNGSRFWLNFVGLGLVLLATPSGWAQTPGLLAGQAPYAEVPAAPKYVCKIYQLRDFAESEELCQWIAETIPEAIQPGSWMSTPRFYPKLALLAVCQTPKAHAEIEEFLKNVKATVPTNDKQSAEKVTKVSAKQGNVVPARYSPPTNNNQPQPASEVPYLVPAPLQQPKHLFHFIMRFEGSGMDTAMADLAKKLSGDNAAAAKDDADKMPLNQLLHFIIRYEGDGIIDANVVEFMKIYAKAAAGTPEGADPLVGESHKGNGKVDMLPARGQPVPVPQPPGPQAVPVPPAPISLQQALRPNFGVSTPAAQSPAPAVENTNEVRTMPPPK